MLIKSSIFLILKKASDIPVHNRPMSLGYFPPKGHFSRCTLFSLFLFVSGGAFNMALTFCSWCFRLASHISMS
jgi:hypothetical protein